MGDYLDIADQNIISIFENEVEFFERFTSKNRIAWRSEDKYNRLLPLSKSYVGYIVTPKRKIELQSKYREIGFEHIFRMYLYLYGYKTSDSPKILDVSKSQTDVDVAKLFFDSLQKNMQTGIIQTYVKTTITSRNISGTVNYRKTYMNYLKGKNKPIETKVSWLSLENLQNRLIVTALSKLRHVKSYSSISSRLLMYFEGVPNNIESGSSVFEKLVFNSNTSRYRQTLLYAAMIIDNLDYDDIGNSVGTESFLVNFDKLFEDFVAKVLKDTPKTREFLTWKDSKKYADILNNGVRFDSREYLPDILYKFKVEDERFDYLPSSYAVLDVKNKAYGIFKNADIYQILMYAKLLNSKKALLIYPSFSMKYPEELVLNPEIFDPSIITGCYINIADNTGENFLKSIHFFVEMVERTISDIQIRQ
ncbi:hypothetical protein AFR80_14310 [Listeria monocytogenes]|nr:hypothetical protein [Listeria monocytogenes]EAD9909391.1 hypothetical protein [Listeria monocytogenes]